jgi:hypothetical protein
MKYLLLVYQSDEDLRLEAEQGVTMQDYIDYANRIDANGNYVAGEALEPTSSATTVRVKNGKILTTDGPFAETKEQLGGFALIEAKDLDEAIRIAADCPASRYGSVEVRPILTTPPPE